MATGAQVTGKVRVDRISTELSRHESDEDSSEVATRVAGMPNRIAVKGAAHDTSGMRKILRDGTFGRNAIGQPPRRNRQNYGILLRMSTRRRRSHLWLQMRAWTVF